MIHALIAKTALLEAEEIVENGLVGLLDWCMTHAGMEKNSGTIAFDHVHIDEPNSVLKVGASLGYTPEEILMEVMYDNDPRSALLVTQDQKLAA